MSEPVPVIPEEWVEKAIRAYTLDVDEQIIGCVAESTKDHDIPRAMRAALQAVYPLIREHHAKVISEIITDETDPHMVLEAAIDAIMESNHGS